MLLCILTNDKEAVVMLSITPDSAEYIIQKGYSAIFLEIQPQISNCCIPLHEAPKIRFGKPKNIADYETVTLNNITIYVPYDLPNIDLTISLASFLGMKRLGLEGWQLA